MRSRFTLVGAAMLFAFVATWAVYAYARRIEEAPAEQVRVVVVNQDVPTGTALDDLVDAGAFEVSRVEPDELVSRPVRSIEDLRGQKTVSPLLAGEQVSWSRLQGHNELPGGVLGLAESHQALTVELEPQRVLGAADLAPGDRIAVFGTFEEVRVTAGRAPSGMSGGEGTFSTTSLLATGVRVLKISASEGTSAATTTGSGAGLRLTLELTPREAQKVVFGQELGGLWISLLPPGENGEELRPISFGEVLGLGGRR